MLKFLFHKHKWTQIGFAHLWRNVFSDFHNCFASRRCENYATPVSVKTFKCYECSKTKQEVVLGHVSEWNESRKED